MRLTQQQAIDLIKKPYAAGVIEKARQLRASALVHHTGEGVKNLFGQLLGVESQNDAKLKEALGKPVSKEITDYIFFEQNRWRYAQGAVKKVDFGKNDAALKQWNDTKAKIWKGDSVEAFVNNWLSRSMYTGFNDFLLIEKPKKTETGMYIVEGIEREQKDAPSHYLVHISITDVVDYRKTGNRVEYLIYRYKPKAIAGKEYKRFRVLDDTTDTIYIQQDNGVCKVDEDESIITYTTIPVRQIGSVTENIENDNLMVSPIDPILPLMDIYVQFYAINSVSEAKNAYPIRWMWGKTCHKCEGTGTIPVNGNEVVCPDCGGFGLKATVMPGSVFLIPGVVNKEGQSSLTGVPAGVIETDIATPEFQRKTLYERKQEIIFSALGSNTAVEAGAMKTATEVDMNSKPLEDRNSFLASLNEAVERWFTDYICTDISAPDYKGATVKYGRKLNLRNENTILTEIAESKKAGASASYIMALHNELIQARYRNDVAEMNRQIALSELEPLPGYTVSEVAGFNFVTDIDKTIKQYFTQVVYKFDESKGDIVTYYEINGYTATVALMQEIAVTMQEKKEPILASTLGVGGTQSMQMILSDPNIDDTKKKGILKVLFGLTDEQMSTIFTNQII